MAWEPRNTKNPDGDGLAFENHSKNLRRNFGLIFEKDEANTKLRTSYNKYHLPVPGAVLRNGKGYVFMTKTNLNLSKELTDGYFEYLKQIGLYDDIREMLDQDANDRNRINNGNLIPLITNSANGLDIPDLSLKIITSAESFRGWKVPMGRNTVDSRNNPTVSITLRDTNKHLCYHLLRAWIRYIELLDAGLIHRKNYNIEYNILDYAASIFYIVVGEDGEEIQYICKFVGVFPTKDPSGIFSTSENSLETPIKISAEFQATFFVPMKIELVEEFNALSTRLEAASNYASYMHNDINLYWKGTPYITFKNGKYYLKFPDGADRTIGSKAGNKSALNRVQNVFNTVRGLF